MLIKWQNFKRKIWRAIFFHRSNYTINDKRYTVLQDYNEVYNKILFTECQFREIIIKKIM